MLVSHGWLVTFLLCALAALLLLEELSFRAAGLGPVLVLIVAFAGGWVALHALQRYLTLFLRAQHYSERSTCKRCGAYGRYRLVGATSSAMIVHCRQCDNEWTIA